MKKTLVPLVLLLLPLLLAAGVFDGRRAFDFTGFQFSSRAWRLSQQVQSYYSGTDWVPGTRVTPYYNPSYPARADSMYMDFYDESTGEWLNGMMTAYLEYNAAGRVIRNTMIINMFGTPIPMMLLTANYDNQNRIQDLHMYMGGGLDVKDDYWTPTYRFHLIYGTGTTFVVYGWEDSGGERIGQYFRSQFEYDAQGRIIEEFSSTSQDSLNWMQESQTEYTYHPQDTTTGADFIVSASANLAFMMMNDGFEFPGLITQELYSEWTGGVLSPVNRTTYQFNNQVQRTQRLEEYYSATNWVPNYQLFYYYYYPTGLLSSTIGQSNDGTGFANDERYEYTWEQYGSASDDPVVPATRLQVKAYPSPFVDELRIEAQSSKQGPLKVTVHNLRGQLLQSYQSTSGTGLVWDGRDASGRAVPAGIYFIRVSQDGSSAVSKVLRIK